ncbi:ThiF family adenylyltransferase, partial [Vicingaceae bacterium]|nr:ThiF family adenylyltransferase [Vicingaceae bacterium]
ENEYGIWAYYPWINKLVHILGENEFVEVRTNRNQNKITKEEQKVLKSKKIGVIGLSVGKSIALTIAMERICGELVLADFDVIELSNLNRIQTGVHNFGLKKTIIVAREIAEIDPYLKITCLHDGLTVENVDDFFTKNGNLDVCVEVCDGLFTKIFAREKAKKFGIPVVMDTNDRGMIDIERFDLEPNRALFHNFIEHLNFADIGKNSSSEEKIPFVNSIIGIDTMSEKLKDSMSEIGKTITTWPQLASSVILGGALTCNVCRRILLNELSDSGRYFVDINDIIKNN